MKTVYVVIERYRERDEIRLVTELETHALDQADRFWRRVTPKGLGIRVERWTLETGYAGLTIYERKDED